MIQQYDENLITTAPMTEETDFFFVTAEEEGVRLDKFLAERFPSYSRTYFQNLIDLGFVLVNGQPAKKRIPAEEGDEIEIYFQATPTPLLEPEAIPLDILYEDDHLLAINKPPGMVVHPAPGHWSGTFVNALLAHCDGKVPGKDPLRPGIVHRLDKDTSGVLVAAKTLLAHQGLISRFASRSIDKLYLAICCGRPTNGRLSAPIGRHPIHRKEMAILSDGREAISEIQVAAFNDQLSLVTVRPFTGRTHQIRVHLKHLRSPILGDVIYGNERMNRALTPARHLLHAYQITFYHPITGDLLKLSAPLPEDLKYWMQRLCSRSLWIPNVIQSSDLG